MTESNRKQAEHQARASRRGGVLRRTRRKDAESASQDKRKAEPNSPKAAKGGGDGLDEDGKVSSLLETTSEEVRQLLEAADDASKQIRQAAQAETGDPGDGRTGKPGETSSLIGKINTEVHQVLEAADEAAEKIRDEARGEARQLIEETRRRAESATNEQMDRVTEMTEQVLGELSAVQERLERLQSAFDQSIRSMGGDLVDEEEEAEVWETQQNENGAPEDEEDSDALRRRLGKRQQRRKSAAEPEGISEGARLLALQQMMAGVDADTLERRLKNEFGIEDPRPILEWMGLQAEQQPEKPKQAKKR